jgi:hypothetical protein
MCHVQFPGLVDILVGQLDSPWDNLRKATAHLFRKPTILFTKFTYSPAV